MYLETEVEMNEFVQPAVLGSPDIQYEGLECVSTGWGLARKYNFYMKSAYKNIIPIPLVVTGH